MLTKILKYKYLIISMMILIQACDCSRKNKCEWVLVPDEKNAKYVEEGYAMVCARNYELERQKCFMTIKLSVIESVYGKYFRMSDAEIDNDKSPKVIKSIKPCTPQKNK